MAEIPVPTATCMRCGTSGVILPLCCSGRDDSERYDNGANYAAEGLTDRYDAVCIRCCQHNHG